MREWFEAGGIEPVYDGAAATPEDAVRRLKASGASIACLCGDDATYAAEAEACARAVKAAGVKGLCLAGRPGEAEAALRAAGVDDFIFAGGDAIAALEGLYRRIARLRRAGRATMSRIPDFSRTPFAAAVGLARRGRDAACGRRPRASTSSRSTARPIAPGSISRTTGRAFRPICAGPIPPCTSTSRGRCASTPAFRPPRSRTPSIAPISPPARRGSPSPSISRPIAATIPTIRASPATSAWPASRSTRSMTCARFFPASRSIR